MVMLNLLRLPQMIRLTVVLASEPDGQSSSLDHDYGACFYLASEFTTSKPNSLNGFKSNPEAPQRHEPVQMMPACYIQSLHYLYFHSKRSVHTYCIIFLLSWLLLVLV